LILREGKRKKERERGEKNREIEKESGREGEKRFPVSNNL